MPLSENESSLMSVHNSSSHPLDYPIWTALTTTQQALAEGDARARRFPTEITPFAATADMSAENFAALGALMSPQDIAVLFTPDAVNPPAGFKVALADTGEQMIGTSVETPANGVDIVTLGVDDVPDMIELTALTKPGPFYARTHELGTFLGIRVDGQLVAMVGERMKPAHSSRSPPSACIHRIAAAATGRCCYPPFHARSYRAAKFPSCTSSPVITRRLRSTGGRGWKSAAVST